MVSEKLSTGGVLISNFELKIRKEDLALHFSKLLQSIWTVPLSILDEVINPAYLKLNRLIIISEAI